MATVCLWFKKRRDDATSLKQMIKPHKLFKIMEYPSTIFEPISKIADGNKPHCYFAVCCRVRNSILHYDLCIKFDDLTLLVFSYYLTNQISTNLKKLF